MAKFSLLIAFATLATALLPAHTLAAELPMPVSGAGPAYSTTDLAGTWNASSLASGPGAPWWERASGTMDSNGSFSGTTMESDGDGGPKTGAFKISPEGIITPKTGGNDNGFRCGMNATKTVFVCTDTWLDWMRGTTEMKIFTKQAAAYSQADLAGAWAVNGLASGPRAPYWVRGTMTIRPDGTFETSLVDNAGASEDGTGAIAISSEGLVTLSDRPANECRMDAGKTLFVCTDTWEDGTAYLMVAARRGNSYDLADLAGVWEADTLASGAGAPWWERGPVTIKPDGAFSGAVEEYPDSHIDENWTGTLNITADGTVTSVGYDSLNCVMDFGKTVMACTATWSSDPGTSQILVFTKRAVSAQVCGDANGDGAATVTDGVQVLRAAAGLSSGCSSGLCDVDGNGTVSVTDGVNVLRRAAGLPVELRCAF